MSFSSHGRTLTKVGVIGSGQIGPDIALYFTKVLSPFGVDTMVVDISEPALARGRQKLEKKIQKGVDSGAFTPEQQRVMLERTCFTGDYDALRGCGLVVEAATENAELKRRIFAQVEGLVPDDALLTSNSSHLEPETVFADVRNGARTAVVHYFFPAERNPIVEVVPGRATRDSTTRWLLSFYEEIGKVPIRVASRYGYALDPVFEGLFLACARLAEEGVATTRQIDEIATTALGMTVGSFTAMNLTGGNPITSVGLDHYKAEIGPWFETPQSLRRMVETGGSWEVPQRGEAVDVPGHVRAEVTRLLRGAYFGLCGEILDAGLVDVSDFDMALELALDMKPAFRFMNEIGTPRALDLVQAYADRYPLFRVPDCIRELGQSGRPFELRNVLRRDEGGVAVLTIRRPKVLNALDQGVFDELARACREADADPAVQAIVLTGFGRKAFASGADVHFLARIEGPDHGEATSAASQAALDAIAACRKPIVCAMNGIAFGGGNELAMACTMRIARAGLPVLAAQPEVNLGIIPGAGGTQRLPRLIGIDAAADMMRTGRPVSSRRAVELGLISEEVDGDLVARARELGLALAKGAIARPALPTEPLAHVPARLPDVDIGHRSRAVDAILTKAILEGARGDLRAGLRLEAKCFGEVCSTRDMRIGVENFLKNGPRSKAAFEHR